MRTTISILRQRPLIWAICLLAIACMLTPQNFSKPTETLIVSPSETPRVFSIVSEDYPHCACNGKVDLLYLLMVPIGGTPPYHYFSNQFDFLSNMEFSTTLNFTTSSATVILVVVTSSDSQSWSTNLSFPNSCVPVPAECVSMNNPTANNPGGNDQGGNDQGENNQGGNDQGGNDSGENNSSGEDGILVEMCVEPDSHSNNCQIPAHP